MKTADYQTTAIRGIGWHAPACYQAEWGGVAIAPLLARYGSPLFVLSEAILRGNIRRLLAAFSARWPSVRYGWSYKTNYLNAVCAIMHQEGAWAEVVSDFEYQKARSLGVSGTQILFNGPWKPAAILEQAVLEGAQIHVDHAAELDRLEAIARRLKRRIGVGIRINFANGGASASWSRFGFNLESGAALAAARRIAASDALYLTGLHSHIGTSVFEVQAYVRQANIMAAFIACVERETACTIEYLDIGGGFASSNVPQGVYLPRGYAPPSFDQYADAITQALAAALAERQAQGRALPTLILESGRALVDDAEVLAATVVGSKRLADGRQAVIVDAGVNLLPTALHYHHQVRPLRHLPGALTATAVYGPLCMNTDVLRQHVMLPPLAAGDALLFSPVGAYNNTQWMPFIQYRPAVVMLMQSGAVEVVRSAEQLAALNQPEHLPQALRLPLSVSPSG